MDPFTLRAKRIIGLIPAGTVSTYGHIALLAGNGRAARQVAWVLHSSSSKDRLPWHRVINRMGKISLPRGGGYEEQRALLEGEGVWFDDEDRVDLCRFGWSSCNDSGTASLGTDLPEAYSEEKF
jgi:methylated-DNA-protein-cysteine methyltransferase-like protein